MSLLELQQDLVGTEHELQVQESRLAEAGAALAALAESRRQAEAEFRRSLWEARAQAESQAADLGHELTAAAQRLARQRLLAPLDGTVQELAITTVGGVVTPAQTLMVVVPAASRLEIEAFVPNRDIGFVREGQAAEIKVEAFTFTRYGLVHGTVSHVSQDALSRDTPAGPELVYAARVALDRAEMEIDGAPVALGPGMAVTVEIRTGRRRVLDYLLSPVLRTRHEAMSER